MIRASAIAARPTLPASASSRPPTRLWALAEECAQITKTSPKRWLRYGEVPLRLALAHLGEKGDVRRKAAFLTWAVRHYAH